MERRQNDWNFTILGKAHLPSELPCNGAEGESGMGTVSLIQLNGGRKCLDARSTEKQSQVLLLVI